MEFGPYDSSDSGANDHLSGQRNLSRLVACLILVVGLTPLGFVWYLDVQHKETSHVFAFLASIGGAAVWWAFFARFAEQQYSKFLNAQLRWERRELRRADSALLSQLQEELRVERDTLKRDIRSREIPDQIYRAQSGYDLRFTRDLTQDLARSSRYQFCGVTGIWVPARLALREGDSLLVELIVADPRSPTAMEHAANERLQRSDYVGDTQESAIEKIREHLFMTLVALFDQRQNAREIVVRHDPGASIHRTELFDDAAYDARVVFRGKDVFPRTARWSADQPDYVRLVGVVEDTMARVPTPQVRFVPWTEQSALEAHLEKLGMEVSKLSEMRGRYEDNFTLALKEVLAKEFHESYEYGNLG